jgi:hypothetical protein
VPEEGLDDMAQGDLHAYLSLKAALSPSAAEAMMLSVLISEEY